MSMNADLLVDGWTIYLWLVVGALILIAVAFGIRWAMRNEQFDEDIKYVMFTEADQDRMDPAEYAKSREVIARQIKRRDELNTSQGRD
ncbi:MAG: hypothetical protein M1392_03590 [Gammaproteobacteria bacterium]|nr:hypothetical protein [Gammaproteobacteria bacterium]